MASNNHSPPLEILGIRYHNTTHFDSISLSLSNFWFSFSFSQFEDQKISRSGPDLPSRTVNQASSSRKWNASTRSSATTDPSSWWQNRTRWLASTIAESPKRLGLLKSPMSSPQLCRPMELTCRPSRSLRRRRRRTSRCGASRPVLLFTSSHRRTWPKPIGLWSIRWLWKTECS